jgi:hypothetical protein
MMDTTEMPQTSKGVTLREYLLSIINQNATLQASVSNERDKQYDARFRAAEIAVNAALAAQEKAVAAAFSSSEKAIVKAEAAQKDYNDRSNEFRGQLDDQAKTLMPRTETDVRFKGVEDKLASMTIAFDGKLEALRAASDKATSANTNDIKGLRESRSAGEGAHGTSKDIYGYLIAGAGILIGLSRFFIK